MDCQYVATQRGGVALVFEGHRYNKVRDGKDGTVYWRCSRDRQCPGRAVTVNHRVKKANNKHNHPPESSLQRNGTHSSSHSSSSISLNTTTSVNNNNSNIINNNNLLLNNNNNNSSSSSNNNNNSHNNVNSHSSLNRLHNCSPSIPSSIHSPSSILTGNNAIAHSDSPLHLSSSSSHHHSHHSRVPLLSTSRSSPSHSTSTSSNNTITQAPSSHLSIQDVIDAHTAAAASFPANFVTEIAKYFASCATSNPHMAAAFASSIASLTPPTGKSYNTGRTPSSISIAPFIPEDAEFYSDNSSDSDQPLNMAIKSSGQFLKKLRSLMKNSAFVPKPINAYIIPSGDSHQSEYIADCDQRRKFISGFTGSSGDAIVTFDDATLWTDGRYFIQAEKELDSNWKLMKAMPGNITQSEWLIKVLPPNSRVGVDPFLMSYATWKPLSTTLEDAGHELVPVPENLIDLVWEDRPAPPANAINPLADKYTGRSASDKISDLRNTLESKNAFALVITALDEVAYLLNLRGSDINYNPVFVSYCVVTLESVYLFVDETKLTPASRKHLNIGTDCPVTELRPYAMIQEFLEWLLDEDSRKIWISRNSSFALVSMIPKNRRILDPSPVALAKVVKNPVEIECMKRSHVKDAVALCDFFSWLEEELDAPSDQDVTEISAAEKLKEFRRSQEGFVGDSFEAISASGPNGAIIHYKPQEDTDRPLSKSEMYLLDSGAQFYDGTTDVTRTLHFGVPSQHQKECFTRVVKGHIALASVIFPKKIKGSVLDTLARKPLWEAGLDYLHGTGHGVGMYLNVHEGPIGISFRAYPDDPGMQEGMVFSNEPGYYEENNFGIRIESLMFTKKAQTPHNFNDVGYLQFETITLVPIQTKLLDASLLTSDEIAWINTFHEQCREVVGEALEKQGRKRALKWLVKETQPIG